MTGIIVTGHGTFPEGILSAVSPGGWETGQHAGG